MEESNERWPYPNHQRGARSAGLTRASVLDNQTRHQDDGYAGRTRAGDKDIWNIVVFIRELPQLKPAAYRELVESSSGHLHDSGEDGPHSHSGMEISGLKISPRKFHLRQSGRYNSETGIRIEEIE
jgi:hypothetical protein